MQQNIYIVLILTESLLRMFQLELLHLVQLQDQIDQIAKEATQDSQLNKENVLLFSQLSTKILTNLHDANYTAEEQIKRNLLDNGILDLEPFANQCDRNKGIIYRSTLAALIAFIMFSFIFVLTLFKRRYLRKVSTVIGYVLFNLTLIATILLFLSLILGSDFCPDSKPLVKRFLKTPILDYFLYCPGEDETLVINGENLDDSRIDLLMNQVQNFTSNANQNALELQNQVSSVQNTVCTANSTIKLCKQFIDLENLASNLTVSLQNILANQIYIYPIVLCGNLTPMVDRLLTCVCTPIFESFLYYFVNYATSTLCYFVLLFFSLSSQFGSLDR